jgi:hypothetical protein
MYRSPQARSGAYKKENKPAAKSRRHRRSLLGETPLKLKMVHHSAPRVS